MIAQEGGVFNDVLIALITSGTAIIVVTIPLWFQHRSTRKKVDQVYDHINRIEDDENVPGERMTLGETVRVLRGEVRDGFKRNDDTHDKLLTGLDAHEQRIDRLEREVE